MLAKVIGPGRGRARETGFTGRVAYVCRKATTIALGHLAGLWTDAAFQMQAVAGLNARLRRPCYHMVLSWGDGENPDDRKAIAAARGMLTEMGWGEHQHVLAVHRDRRNVHVHLVLNRVHPITGKAFATSHDYARLERACRVVERAFGWPPDRGRFLVELDGDTVILVPRPKAHWDAKRAARAEGVRPDPRGVRGAERRTGVAPLRDRLPPKLFAQARMAIGQAADWATMHRGLLRLGLRYVHHLSGARIAETATGTFMPASHLGAAYGLHRLTARLGPFRPGPPHPPAAADANARVAAEARQRHALARRQRQDEFAALRESQKAARAGLRARLEGLDRRIAAAFRRVLAQDQREERGAFRTTSLPRLADYGLAPPAADALPPRQELARRHRHLLRAERVRAAGGQIATGPLDHTRARQLWEQAAARAAPGDPGGRTDHALLRVGPRQMLLPRRDPRGAILGYDLLAENGNGFTARSISGQDLALGMIGPADAENCVVAVEAGTAAMLSAARPDLLVIVAAPKLSARTARQLAETVGRRAVHVVCRQEVDAAFAARVTALLPQAVRLDLEPRAVPGQAGEPHSNPRRMPADGPQPPEPAADDAAGRADEGPPDAPGRPEPPGLST